MDVLALKKLEKCFYETAALFGHINEIEVEHPNCINKN